MNKEAVKNPSKYVSKEYLEREIDIVDISELVETCNNQEEEIKQLRSQIKAVQYQLTESIKAIGFYERILKAIREESQKKYHA